MGATIKDVAKLAGTSNGNRIESDERLLFDLAGDGR